MWWNAGAWSVTSWRRHRPETKVRNSSKWMASIRWFWHFDDHDNNCAGLLWPCLLAILPTDLPERALARLSIPWIDFYCCYEGHGLGWNDTHFLEHFDLRFASSHTLEPTSRYEAACHRCDPACSSAQPMLVDFDCPSQSGLHIHDSRRHTQQRTPCFCADRHVSGCRHNVGLGQVEDVPAQWQSGGYRAPWALFSDRMVQANRGTWPGHTEGTRLCPRTQCQSGRCLIPRNSEWCLRTAPVFLPYGPDHVQEGQWSKGHQTVCQISEVSLVGLTASDLGLERMPLRMIRHRHALRAHDESFPRSSRPRSP